METDEVCASPIIWYKGHQPPTAINMPLGPQEPNTAPHAGAKSDALPPPTEAPMPTFTLFPMLPTELPNNIWNFAAREPRFIEFLKSDGMGNYRIAKPSLKPPAVLHTCYQSRSEAQRVYKKRTFQLPHGLVIDEEKQQHMQTFYNRVIVNPLTRARHCLPWRPIRSEVELPYVWYNSAADIVLFGDGQISVMQEVFRLEQVIERVGYVVQGHSETGSWDVIDRTFIRGPNNLLKILHGHTTEPSMHQGFDQNPGCLGLKEVMLVVKSKIFHPKAGKIDHNTGWCHAMINDFTTREIEVKRRLDYQVSRCNAGISLWEINGGKEDWNKWKGDKMPLFTSISLTPFNSISCSSEPNVLEAMNISGYSMKAIRPYLTPDAIKHLDSVTGCQFFIPKQKEDFASSNQVAFYGRKQAVQRSKKAIKVLMKRLMQEGVEILGKRAQNSK